MINVTKSYLPAIEDYHQYLSGIWERNWLTNFGPLAGQLEESLKQYLGVKHLFFVTNGTIALQLAIKALNLKGEIITTPFSYVATTSSIVWEGCAPIFVDVNADTLCIDPNLIEVAITDKTAAILATHVYGNACDVLALSSIAKRHNLKLIYDAAHAFGVKSDGNCLLNFGDVSTLSFHATKLFHTVEGGAVITNDDDVAFRISYMMNFGHNGTEDFFGLGINGKNSEMHAAMGLCILPKIEDIIAKRKDLSNLYKESLAGTKLRTQRISKGTAYNYAYYPLIFDSEQELLSVMKALNERDIFPRRYFYPALTKLNYVRGKESQVAEFISERILCLPLYYDLGQDTVRQITDIIKANLV